MSAKRRRAKQQARLTEHRMRWPDLLPKDSDWVSSGRIACSYGTHAGNPCTRCGAEYAR